MSDWRTAIIIMVLFIAAIWVVVESDSSDNYENRLEAHADSKNMRDY